MGKYIRFTSDSTSYNCKISYDKEGFIEFLDIVKKRDCCFGLYPSQALKLNPSLLNDVDVARALVSAAPSNFKYLPESLRSNKEMLLYALWCQILDLNRDFYYVSLLAETKLNPIFHCSKELMQDPKILGKAFYKSVGTGILFKQLPKKIVLEALLEYLKLTGKEYHKPHIFKDFLDDDIYEILSFICNCGVTNFIESKINLEKLLLKNEVELLNFFVQFPHQIRIYKLLNQRSFSTKLERRDLIQKLITINFELFRYLPSKYSSNHQFFNECLNYFFTLNIGSLARNRRNKIYLFIKSKIPSEDIFELARVKKFLQI